MNNEKSGFIDLVLEIQNCQQCSLYKNRSKAVIGQGSLNANVMFIGEAPGYNEDREGRPFVGKAGKLFDTLLRLIDLQRDDVYITNLLKCRPPKNQEPLKEEIKVCSQYLDKQVEIINPKILVPLGRFAAAYTILKFGANANAWLFKEVGYNIYTISAIHSVVFKSKIGGIILPLYHPAVGLYNPEIIPKLCTGFKELERWVEYYRDCRDGWEYVGG